MLDTILAETVEYFLKETNPQTGLVPDRSEPGAPASIAASGLALSVFVIAAERGLISHNIALARVLNVLRFFNNAPQGPEPGATGYHGFFYHFLDANTGKRVQNSELSVIDTALFLIGALVAGEYFNRGTPEENSVFWLAENIYKKTDWVWATNGQDAICHGWRPGAGFLPYYWNSGYNEAHLLYILALGSPTFPVNQKAYLNWTNTFETRTYYDTTCTYAAPLFIHQLPQCWLNFKGIQDDYNRRTGMDYFENSRRATIIQQQYAIDNPHKFAEYGPFCWGFTASDGPGPVKLKINSREKEFFGYIARGAPDGPDDGTVSPWAVAASLPFTPAIVIDSLRYAIGHFGLKKERSFGFEASFNPSFPENSKNPNGWVSPWKFALNQGPVILMIDNFQNGLMWKLTSHCPYIINGLRRAGFSGGWLSS